MKTAFLNKKGEATALILLTVIALLSLFALFKPTITGLIAENETLAANNEMLVGNFTITENITPEITAPIVEEAPQEIAPVEEIPVYEIPDEILPGETPTEQSPVEELPAAAETPEEPLPLKEMGGEVSIMAQIVGPTTVTHYEHLATRIFNTTAPLGTAQSNTFSFPKQTTTKAWVFTKDTAEGQSGTIILKGDVQFYGAFAAAANGDKNNVHINWQLVDYNSSSGAETEICRTPILTGGALITSTTATVYNRNCTLANNYKIPVGDYVRVNIYGYNLAKGAIDIIHYWDTATYNSRHIFAQQALGSLSISLTSPSTNQNITAGQTFAMNCTATCAGGDCFGTSVYAQYNNGSGVWQNISSAGALALNGTETNPHLILGTGNFTGTEATAFKIKGNIISNNTIRCDATSTYTPDAISPQSISISVIPPPDIVAPQLTLTNPADNSTDSDGFVIFRYIVNDSSAIASCKLIIDGTVSSSSSSVAKGIEQDLAKSSIAQGSHSWRINCTDEYSNEGSSATRQLTVNLPANYTNATLTINTTIVNSQGVPVNATIEFIDAGSGSADYNSTSGIITNITSGTFNIKITPQNNVVKSIVFIGVNVTGNITSLVDIDDSPETAGWVENFAINPLLNYPYSAINVTAAGKGKDLFKCENWNFTARACADSRWKYIRDIAPGQNYTFTLGNATDPGVAESNQTLAVIDSESYLVNHTQIILGSANNITNITVVPAGYVIKNITIYSFNENGSDELGLDNALTLKDGFAVDTSALNFNHATLTATASSDSSVTTLYKCPSWNFTMQECALNDWVKSISLTLGADFSLNISAGDPGFVAGSPSIGTPDGGYIINGNGNDESGGTYVNTQINDTAYYYTGESSNAADIANSSIVLIYNITSLNITPGKIINLSFGLIYCHSGDNAAPVCNGGTPAEKAFNGDQNVEIYNYSSATWLDIGNQRTTDAENEIYDIWNVTSAFSNFVDASNNILIRYSILTVAGAANTDAWLVIDYAPLTVTYDNIPPSPSNNKTSPVSPANYSPTGSYQFNITWTDNYLLNETYFEHNFTGTAANYSPTGFAGNTTAMEYYYNYGALAAGSYYWKSYANDSKNNSNSSLAFEYAVNKAASTLSLNITPNASVTFGTTTTANCTASTTQITPQLYRNGTSIGASYETAALAAGSYNYSCNASATQNYTAPAEQSSILTINTTASSIALELNGAGSNLSASQYATVNITAYLTTPAAGYIEIYENSTLLSNGSSPRTVLKAYNTTGTYNITALYPATQNYSSSFKTYFIAVTADSTPPSVAILSPLAGADYNQSQTVLISANISDPSGISSALASIIWANGSESCAMNERLFYDDFSSANLTGWTPVLGNWTVSAGAVFTAVSENQRSLIVTGESSWQNYTYSSKVRENDNGGDLDGVLVFRYQNLTDYYKIEMDTDTGTGRLHIDRTVNNTESILSEVNFSYSSDVWYWQKVLVNGSVIKAKAWRYDSAEPGWMVTASDSSIAAGKVGYTIFSSNATFDDPRVNLPGSGGSSGSYDCEFTNTNYIGRYNVTIVANDSNGYTNNTQTTYFNVNDITKPVVRLMSPEDNSYNNASINFVFNASDNSGFSLNCSLYIDSILTATNNSVSLGTPTTFAIIGISQGLAKQWNISCIDVDSNSGSSVRAFNIDTSPPSTTITSPPDSTNTTDPTPTITFVSTDNLAASINYTIFVDGAANGQAGTAANNTPVSIDLLSLSQTSHTIVVQATDIAGNSQNSTPLTITIVPPTVYLSYPPNNAYLGNSNINFTFNVSDPTFTTLNCSIYLNGLLNQTNESTARYTQTEFAVAGLQEAANQIWNVSCANPADVTASDRFIFSIDLTAPSWSNNTESPSSPANYSNSTSYQFSVSWIDNIALNSVLIEHNFYGTLANYSVSSSPPVYNYNTGALAAGSYLWKMYATDFVGNQNQTTQFSYIVNKATPLLTLTADPYFIVNENTLTSVLCTANTGQVSPLLYRNGTSVSNPDTATLPIGLYQYVCNNTAMQNYTTAQSIKILQVTAKNLSFCSLAFNPASGGTWPVSVNASCSCTNPETTATLWRGGINVTATENNQLAALAAGSYNYICNATETQNYSYGEDSSSYAINKAASAINLTLNGADANMTTERKSSVTKTATIITPAAGAVELYEQGALIASGNSPLTNTSAYNSIGIFNITAVYPATQNYTSSNETHFITVQDTTPPATITNLANQSQTPYSIYWSWTNPADNDFSRTEIWIDSVWQANVSAPINYYNATGLLPNTTYVIQTRTVDNYGNINTSWVNGTAATPEIPDTQAPYWLNNKTYPASPVTYSPAQSYQFNVSWTDNIALNTVYFEHNFTGSAANYTPTGFVGNATNREYYYNYGPIAAGTYYWMSYASDGGSNWNFTGVFSYVVNQAASSLSLAITPSSSVTYGTATTANCTASTPQIIPQLFRNGTFVGANYETATLAAGSYNYSCNASATQNYTAPAEQSSILSVNKNATATELWLNGARSNLNITYPAQVNASAITSALFAALLRNGTNVDAENGVYASLAAGSYNYTAINYGNENYTDSDENWLLTINKNTTTCSLAVDPVSGQTWPASVNASCSCTNPEAAAKLWRNNADVTATENSIFTLLPAGNWSYVCNATATQNYTYAENASSYTINKAASSINLLLSGNDANFSTTNATQVNITAELATPATGNIAIYENGALLDSGSSPRTVLKIYHTPAVYNITAVYPATQNYSSSYETHFLEITVADLTPPIITGHDAKPRVIIAGRNVTINTTVADNVAVDKLWAVITRPDLTTQTIYPPALFATTIDGTYNITFYANDSSGNNAAPATDYFIAAAPLNFTITVIDANSTGIETTLTDYFPGTDEQIDLENFTGGETIEEPNYIFDLLFSSYNDALQARLNSVNLSANNNLTLGMDKLPTPTSSYIVSYALNRSSFNFTNAILKLSYAGASYSNEANLRVYKCDSWDFANRVCTGAFALLPDAVQNMAGKYFTVNVTSFSGFSIKEETLVVPPSGGVRHPAPPSEAPSAPPVVPPEAAPTVAPPVTPPAVTPPAVEQPAEIVPASIDEIVPGTTLAVAPEITGKVSCGFITNAVSPQIEAKAVDASVLRLIKIPAGYEMIDQFKLDCSGDNLEVTLNLPEGYTDVKALGCRQGQCTEVEGVVNRNSMICGGKTIGELVDQKITKIKEIINPEEFAVLQSQSKTITSQSRVVFSGKNSIEFAGEIPSEITATVGSPKTAIPAPKNYGALIMGTPLVLQLSKRLYSNAIITMPILDVAGFEQDSLEIYALQNNEWTLIGGRQDKIARTITAQIENISSYLDIENKVTFAVIGVKCKACAVASFDKLYNGAGSRNALVLVHGLFADEHPFGPLIEELSYNSQPWQIWRFMYPTSLTVEEIAEQLSDSLESHVGEYDSIYLIGHSLGGIVVQRAVADANERQLEWLAKVGKVVLTGTPNDGSPAKEIYSRLFNSLVNLDTAAKLFDINSDIIQTITQPQNMPLVKGIDYQVVAGIHGYDFTADLFSAGQKNDGIITTTSAQHVGGSYINNSCSNYYEINITHTDLNDNPVAVRVLERIINKDLAKQNTNKVYVGYNQYFKIAVKGCSSQDAYVLIGKKIKEEKAPDPINCNCGNGWCGVDETPDNCPVDCARPVTTESICLFLPVIICIPVIIIAALLLIAGILWISNKKPGMLNKPLAVFAIIALAISFYQYITCKEFTLLSIIINAAKSLFATTTALVIAIVAVAAILLILFIRYFGANAQRIFHRKEMHELDIRQQRLERLNAILERKIQMHLQKKEGK